MTLNSFLVSSEPHSC